MRNKIGGKELEISSLKAQITNLEDEVARAKENFRANATEYGTATAPPIPTNTKDTVSLVWYATRQVGASDSHDTAQSWHEWQKLKQKNDNKVQVLKKNIHKLGIEVRELHKEKESLVQRWRLLKCN